MAQRQSPQHTVRALPWFAIAFLMLFMLAGIAGGVGFFLDGQWGAGLIFWQCFAAFLV